MSALSSRLTDAGVVRVRSLRQRALAERRWSTVTIAIGIAIVVGIPLLSLVAPLLGFGDPNQQDLANALAPPSLEHPFGTDNVGRDLFARTLSATWLDYQVAFLATLAPLLIGLVLGGLAGYFGGSLDSVIMRVVDIMIAFPLMIFVMAMGAIFGPGLTGVYVGLIGFGWAFFARVSRAEMLVLRERQYVAAARTLGISNLRILLVHALPGVLRPNLVVSMATIVVNILALAGFSYLGLGVQPPAAEWGALVADGQTYLFSNWWLSTLPGLVIVIVGVGFSLIGDGLADRLGYEFRLTV